MNVPFEITFGFSASVNYAQAVRLAHRIPGYTVTGAGKEVVHTMTMNVSLADRSAWEQLRELLQLVSGWRSTRVRVAGKRVRYWAFSSRLAQVKACYARKLEHDVSDAYCSGKSPSNPEATHFGCRFSKGVSRGIHISNYAKNSWIDYGALTPGRRTFLVDKTAILMALEEQTRAEACLLCPAFQWQRLRADVDELPERIKLGEQSKFEVRYSKINPQKALGIQPKQSAGDAVPGLELGGEPHTAAVRKVPAVHYADIAGQDAALEQIKNVVELPLIHAAYFEALGVAPQSGVILYGPPGNGKTLLAKAVATESNAHLEIISGPEILSRWVGQSEENLRGIFARARQFAPSVVLIDELDSIAPRRDMLSVQHEVQLLSQLLVLLDGLEARGRVAVVATTNRLEAVDPAVRRPGRFDYHVAVPCPDLAGRAAILRVCLAKLKTRRALPVEALAKATDGFSGAELAALCREAGIHAICRGLAKGLAAPRLVVTRADVHQALKTLRAKRVPESVSHSPANFFPTIASTCSATRGKD
jgi:ATP-dependent 26S proteasome regulatory subunit